MVFKIDTNIPMPARGKGRSKYPWKQLNVGQSFFVPLDGQKSVLTLQSSLNGSGPRHGIIIKTCQMTEHGKRGVRVWRIK